jgi:small subunit ribosomal protein S16
MSLRIRLKRNNKKHNPFYGIVVIDSRKKRDGEYIEKVGWYDPLKAEFPKFSMNMERINYWIGVGAQPSDRVAKFINIEKTGQHFVPEQKSE